MVMPGDNVDHGRRADRADRHGGEAALRHPRRRPHRRRRRRRLDHRIAENRARRLSRARSLLKDNDNERPEHPHPAEGVRSPRARQVDARDRQHGQADGRAGARPDPAADAGSRSSPSTARRTSTRRAASSSRSAPTSALLDIVDPTPQTVDALMKLDLAAGVDVEIKL